ncbi:hypothetical protein [Caulobacter vibrioides]|uniref:hypothetical protein n=1 Tax=Caulobacter vibrioides TaxID=155892 RepID=UPI000BB51629|nr:hypothetical protein [Caulobacter vibrioides]ATC26483.1 hypothetical protein CA608_19090 [Caulobacter vibrioides]PLR12305.1 hypothetical protein CVUC_08720 [Caulobacter vibrioides]
MSWGNDQNLRIEDLPDFATRARGVLRHSGVTTLADAAANRGAWRDHPLATKTVIAHVEDVLAEYGAPA